MDANSIDHLSDFSLIGSGPHIILLQNKKSNKPFFILRDIVLTKDEANAIFWSLLEANGETPFFDHGKTVDFRFDKAFSHYDKILFCPRPSKEHGVVYSLQVTSKDRLTSGIGHDIAPTIAHVKKVLDEGPVNWLTNNIKSIYQHTPFHYLETAFIFSDAQRILPLNQLRVISNYSEGKISFIRATSTGSIHEKIVDMTIFDCAGMSWVEIQKKKIEDHFVKSTYNPLTPKAIGLGVIDKVELAKAPSETPNKITMIPIDKIRPEIGKTVLFAYAVYGAECVAWSIGKLVRVIEDEGGVRYELVNELCQPIVANYWTSLPSKWL